MGVSSTINIDGDTAFFLYSYPGQGIRVLFINLNTFEFEWSQNSIPDIGFVYGVNNFINDSSQDKDFCYFGVSDSPSGALTSAVVLDKNTKFLYRCGLNNRYGFFTHNGTTYGLGSSILRLKAPVYKLTGEYERVGD